MQIHLLLLQVDGMNMNKTRVMISGERQMVRQKDVRWPCVVCSKGVGSNSVQCSSCQKWVHEKCSGIKRSMSKVAKSFICRGCLNSHVALAVQCWVKSHLR